MRVASDITPRDIEMMKEFLEKHPIDPSYDEECEYFDGDVPEEQLLARAFKEYLDKYQE